MNKTEYTAAVMLALNLVLASRTFISSPKLSAFLTYIVTETLAGKGNRIKAYSIAIDALDKPTSFDPQQNPAVRVMALRLRNALNNFNAEPNLAIIKIEMQAGTYIPIFTIKYDTVSPANKNDARTRVNLGLKSKNPLSIQTTTAGTLSCQNCLARLR